MMKEFEELEFERDMLQNALDQCNPDDEERMQELQDKLDIVQEELDINPDEY